MNIKHDINENLKIFKNTPNSILIDVRSKGEYKSGKIPDSINIPLDEIRNAKFENNPKLFVHCLSGGRSEKACSILKNMGYDAINIGGISDYKGNIE